MLRHLILRSPPTPSDNVDMTDFHFCRLFPGDNPASSLVRHEHYLYAKLGIKSGQRGLHIGCGSGTIALELVRYANVSVVGVDTDAEKVRLWACHTSA